MNDDARKDSGQPVDQQSVNQRAKPSPPSLPKQPSPQAIEILAKMMVNRAKREGKINPKPSQKKD